jgi:hypothetical protein
MTIGNPGFPPGHDDDHQHVRRSASCTRDIFTIFEGTSEIQRMIVVMGTAVSYSLLC